MAPGSTQQDIFEMRSSYTKMVQRSKDLAEQLKQLAYASGFDLAGITSAERFDGYRWQESIMRDPLLTMADAQSILIVGVSELKFLKESAAGEPRGRVARSYAAGHEYNLVDELLPLKRLLEEQGYKACVSPGSIAESTIPMKLAAVRAGLGWQGKHSVVITPEFGSWVAFGALLTDAPLKCDEPTTQKHCGECTLCLEACPMVAISAPYVVNPLICFDTILNSRGLVPNNVKDKVGNRILSCDACLEVCPYSSGILKKSDLTGEGQYEFNLLELLLLDEPQFEETFGRLHWSIDFVHFKRNVIMALGNSGDATAISVLETLKENKSRILRNAVEWALAKGEKS